MNRRDLKRFIDIDKEMKSKGAEEGFSFFEVVDFTDDLKYK